MSDTERIIELVLRFKTNGYQDELDDLMAYGPQIQEDMAGPDAGSEELRAHDGADLHLEYLPTGSHWRDVTPTTQASASDDEAAAYARQSGFFLPFDPPAAGLPGGNRLSAPQED